MNKELKNLDVTGFEPEISSTDKKFGKHLRMPIPRGQTSFVIIIFEDFRMIPPIFRLNFGFFVHKGKLGQ